ncbi:hypothetical protein RJ640_006747 [Escallonia rubra]|uniref:Retrovirus-related Pol polyprotein from transposon TNT 1-94-like beta-barrel domain-containing protein n=1 Tax=Escallonia rubra TaxID=112253 RepID=A0AA88RTQ3_9ASTE|nr:hypothetical protein RJ640_006747 [Escallonia rubra]
MASSSSTSIVAATSPSLVTSTHTFSIKLTSKNYLAWKTQFLPILNYQNFHGHIDGTSSPPPKTLVSPTAENLHIPNLEYEAWFKKDQLLLSWLFSSLTEEIFSYIIGLSTSQEVWIALAHSFGSVSQNCQLQLYIELQELKKNDLSISEYLHKAKSLSDELNAAGKPVSPAEFNAIIYRNIGSNYHSIITALNLRQEPVSFYELHGQLVAHEILLKHSLTPTKNIVLRGSPPLLPAPPSSSTFKPHPNNQPSNNYRRRNRGPCQICCLTNHIALTCRNRYAPRQQTQSPHNSNFQNRNFNASANYSNVTPPLNWFPDTAANYHLTPDVNALNDVNEYMGNDQLHDGNGQGLQIIHTGNASIHSNTRKLDLRNILCVPKIVKNFLFVQRFTFDNSCFFEFLPNHFVIKDQRTKKVLMEGPSEVGIYSLRQPKIDISNAFLHGYLADENHLEQPMSYVHKDFPNHRSHMYYSSRILLLYLLSCIFFI